MLGAELQWIENEYTPLRFFSHFMLLKPGIKINLIGIFSHSSTHYTLFYQRVKHFLEMFNFFL